MSSKIQEGDTFMRLKIVRRAIEEDFTRLGQQVKVGPLPGRWGPRAYWLCSCVCGGETITEAHQLTRKHTTSCGCYARELRKILIDKTQQPRILYRDFAFRSSWELVFALFCEKNNVSYDYEPRWFPVMIDGKEFDYKPDFFLSKLETYVEIKGRIHGNSVKKFRVFAAQLAKAYILFEDSIKSMLIVSLQKWTRKALQSLKHNIVDLRNSPELVEELKAMIAPFDEVFDKKNSRFL
jgi:hypothetical protein